MSDTQFNFSNWNFPADRIWLHIPETEIIIKLCTFIPVLIFGLLGNYTIIRLTILNRALRTPTNLFVANMAMADFLTLLISSPMFLINDFYQNYLLGSVGCIMEGFLEGAFLMAAVLNLSAVSYDRLTAIVLPTKNRLTMRGAKIVICLSWLVGILIALPLAIYRSYKVRYWKNFTEMYCKENTDIFPKYWYVLMTVMVWLPLSIMLICYSAIFVKLDRYEKRVLNREHPLTVSYKRKVARTLFIITVVFVVLRLPFTLLIILRDKFIANTNNMIEGRFRIFWYASQYLMFLNAAINPVIYGYNNDNFRRAYAEIPLCKCCRSSIHQSINSNQTTHLNWLTTFSNGFKEKFCCSPAKPKRQIHFNMSHHNLYVGQINYAPEDKVDNKNQTMEMMIDIGHI